MVDILSMVDLTSISAMLAATGVLVGVVFAILELRNLTKTRQTDIVIRIYSTVGTEEWQEAWDKVKDSEIVDYKNYERKHGFKEVNLATTIFEGVGILLHRKLIDVDLVYDLFGSTSIMVWEKVKPLIEHVRKQQNRPDILKWFEHLTNEMQKYREQRLQQTQT